MKVTPPENGAHALPPKGAGGVGAGREVRLFPVVNRATHLRRDTLQFVLLRRANRRMAIVFRLKWVAIQQLRNKVAPYNRVYLDLAGRKEAAWADHRRIYDACVQRDAKLAEVETRQHLEQLFRA